MQTALWAAVVTVVQGQAGTEGNQGAEPRGSGTSGEPDHAGEIRGSKLERAWAGRWDPRRVKSANLVWEALGRHQGSRAAGHR